MMTILRKELHQIIIALSPIVYLGIIYNSLPSKVPIHWNIQWEIDRYGNKSELILIAIFPLLLYLIFIMVPLISPKIMMQNKGKKFQKLKTLFILLMSLLSVYILFAVKGQTLYNPNIIILLLGVLYIVFGNYSKTIKANYFIGIRTPWTLKNETVWKKTHILGGKLWFVGGIIIVLLSLIVSKTYSLYVFLIITAIITLIPIVYSYTVFNKLNNSRNRTNI